jgi:predicted nucleotidyltransferase
MEGIMTASWAITPEKVELAIKRIVEISQPRKLILFGSYVKKTTDLNSDLDIIVVTRDEVKNARKESVRIRRALKGISMPMDILVISESRLKELADAPGMIYREALREGKVVYDCQS